jgi:putative Holliday junction resolvase
MLSLVTEQNLLAVDFGERRIGLAVSEGPLAVPLAIVQHESRVEDIERIVAIALEREVDAVVVGLPLLPSGDEGDQARRCRRFGEALARRIDVPVLYQDETLTTGAAREAARELVSAQRSSSRGRQHVDDLAAARILQTYLDEQGRHA